MVTGLRPFMLSVLRIATEIPGVAYRQDKIGRGALLLC
ncbi:hypothetical protein D515_03191 [Grimontia indica]|uniref:Uncharacterized protein n=1 Tax=Grimontia indica TaxID=1056512 RepID=R1GPD4_9GAMM|nr:hypothetical protein D515_03191 [Grimontia indica]